MISANKKFTFKGTIESHRRMPGRGMIIYKVKTDGAENLMRIFVEVFTDNLGYRQGDEILVTDSYPSYDQDGLINRVFLPTIYKSPCDFEQLRF